MNPKLRHFLCATGAWLFSMQAASALPDLRGYNGLVTGGVSYPFDIQETSADWGDAIHIRFAEANFGDAAGTHKIGIFVSADSNIDPVTDVRIATYNVGSIGASGVVFVNYGTQGTITLPASNPLPGAPTTIYFGMVVDVDGQVTEGDETNNRNLGSTIDRDDTPLTITPPVPDIFATDSVAPNNDAAIPFGSVANDGPGQSRGVQTLTVINKGKASLNVTGITVTGSAFSLVEIASSTQSFISTTSLPRVIAKNGGESWVFTVQFDPATTGAATGTLSIATNDPDTPVLAIALSGTGSPIPDIALTTPEAVETDFGGVLMDGAGGVSATRTITLKNVGSGPLTVSQNGISLLTGAPFSLVSVTSSTQGVLNLATAARTMAAATETWDVVVRFDPTALGTFTDGLKVLSDDPDEATFTVSLRGQGLNPMKLEVTDSSGSPTDKSIAYPGTHADGAGLVASSATVTLKNSGEAPLTVSQNGITFATGTHFTLGSVISDVAGAIDLTIASKQIASGNAETWTATILFDPTTAGALTDTLRIASDDPALALTTVALSGTGLNEPDLSITDSVTPPTDLAVNFGPVLNDGAGSVEVLQTAVLKNLGAQPLVIGQNGLTRTGSTAFRIVSVVSSTDGPVDVSSASAAVRTISPAQAETWTVTLGFDPTADGAVTATLGVASNDPQTPSVSAALSGTGSTDHRPAGTFGPTECVCRFHRTHHLAGQLCGRKCHDRALSRCRHQSRQRSYPDRQRAE